jgi:hypothetical protein
MSFSKLAKSPGITVSTRDVIAAMKEDATFSYRRLVALVSGSVPFPAKTPTAAAGEPTRLSLPLRCPRRVCTRALMASCTPC